MSNRVSDTIIKEKIFDSFIFWERRRMLFNVLVGITGLIVLIYLISFTLFPFNIFEFFGIFLWAFIANVLYSVGYVFESIIIFYSNGNKSFEKYRLALFCFGTMLYMLFSICYGFLMALFFPID